MKILADAKKVENVRDRKVNYLKNTMVQGGE